MLKLITVEKVLLRLLAALTALSHVCDPRTQGKKLSPLSGLLSRIVKRWFTRAWALYSNALKSIVRDKIVLKGVPGM